jgi:ribosome biogenesis protein NSA1
LKESEKASVPTRLTSFQLSHTGSTFAYGGDEIDLSVWSVSRAFGASADPKSSTDTQGTKRKNKAVLFPAETWRAKNLPNDALNLRRPVHITSLTYLPDPSEKQLAVGTYSGAIRCYDTRAARRPIANWEKVVRDGQGSVSVVKTGLQEQ